MPVISPQSVERNNSCYTYMNGPTAELHNQLVLTFDNNTGLPYKIPVYVNSMYKITYYDSCIQSQRTITGLVTGVSEETIAVSVTVAMDSAGNVCLCTNRDRLAGYVSTTMYYVPITNISSILLVDPSRPTPDIPNERCEEFVSILGISSTIIKAIIVRLKIFNDDVHHSATPIDMVVNGQYHVVYTKDNSIFELNGRLIAIEEIPVFGNESMDTGYVRPDSNKEVVGAHGNIYDPNYFYNLPKCNPDGDRIRLVFDTSKDFVKLTDCVMLKDIRNVIPIGDNCGCFPPPMPPCDCGPYPPCPPQPCPPPCPPYPPHGCHPPMHPDHPGCYPPHHHHPGIMPLSDNSENGAADCCGTAVPSWAYDNSKCNNTSCQQSNIEQPIVYEKLNDESDMI